MKQPTELFHYSSCEVKELVPTFHDRNWKHYGYTTMKPHGIWFSVEDYEDDQNWKTWCEGEEFRLGSLKYKYRVTLKPCEILFLHSPKQVIDFGKKYVGNDLTDWYKYQDKLNSHSPRSDYIYQIEWGTIMDRYKGIIIAPYQWCCRMGNETSWYYGWDCASGCIWNLDAIESFTLDSISDIEYPEEEEISWQKIVEKIGPIGIKE